MQKIVEKIEKPARPEKPKKPEKAASEFTISAPRFAIMTVHIKNLPGSPLIVHAFSAKQRQIMRDKQIIGTAGKKKTAKDPKNFDDLYNGARYISEEGWDGCSSISFQHAMIGSCRLVGYKMTIAKMSVFVEPDGRSASCGTPLIRIYGEPYPFENIMRNATGVADIRVRPRWDEWSAVLRIRFDREQFLPEDVINLLVRAGSQNGVGEGRPSSKENFGQGCGLFVIDTSKGVQLTEIEGPKIKFENG